ncbi:MAG: TerB family tellurite resistance protein [Candidatus Marinimicrobia bacterium]|jgi:uncharacterized tellurite resistance protein B-like protein|nr:TerB family tellurite resistance protein [Candidatus Neomarinimicrobiota bacterium]
MFLNLLNQEEKITFLKLAHHVANSDNDFSESQQSIIGKYCTEMQINDIDEDEKKEDYLISLKKIDKSKSQKIVLLEILALIYSDQYVHPEEQKVLDQMLEIFSLSTALSVVYTEWSKSILALYVQGSALIEL